MVDGRIEGLVSVVIPVYNRPLQLREAVASVLAQDHRPIEVLIVDDGSTDGITRNAAEELAEEFPSEIQVISRSNGGPGAAREAGRQIARGEFIQYLDSDDVLLPGKFSSQVAALRRVSDAQVAYGYTRYRYSDGTVHPLPWKGSGVKQDAMFPAFVNDRWWDTPNPLYRAVTCDAAGPWTDLRIEEDWEYDCRIAAVGGRLVWCESYVCEVRDHAGPRLCRSEGKDSARLQMQARSRALIWSHALRAGLPESAPGNVRAFSRSMFLLARQCGAVGLVDESRMLFNLAKEAAGSGARKRLDFQIYARVAGLVGWQMAGKLSSLLDRVRTLR